MMRAFHHPLCSVQKGGRCDYDCARDYAPEMTPSDVKAARKRLGYSARELAEALNLGVHGGRTVRRWESGETPITGPAKVAIQLMLERSK